MECNVKFGGEAGHGLLTLELELTERLSRIGCRFFATKNYMSRIRGGHNFHMVRIAEGPVHALSGDPWDVVIAFDEESERRHRATLQGKGIFISKDGIQEIEKTARDAFGDVRATHSILVGVILSIIGYPLEKLMSGADTGAFNYWLKGYETADRWSLSGAFPVTPRAKTAYRFDGNQALAFGALLGGCQFMAGYPMTPASSIMNYIAQASLKIPVHFEQAEDEIAAINMALGASYAGVRSMVATSGGGFALMTEGVSLAGMTETPIVIIEAQRPGPSTGLPTRTEQGDLNFVLHAGHGEFPRAVFAPGSIDEAVAVARRSFDLSDRYQAPVFILTDQYFADSIQLIEEAPALEPQRRDYGTFGASYRRYALTHDGVSPLACPGVGAAVVKVDSDEHDEEGTITEDLDLRIRMVDKRLQKLSGLGREVIPPSFFGDNTADVLLVCWGSNKLIMKEAVERLNRRGRKVGGLHFSQVYPLDGDMTAGFDLAGKTVVCIENNATGQFAGLLKRELGVTVSHRILKYNGECFTVREICDRVVAFMEG
ncbi:MAG TPA: 2-oxoacid:acceptor oxidoreductase subunit alpha [Syntrophales bacterium]|nr:2-oxoacid:acceptor oxidoreductase subunit alpha [Syntrophales bacterium]